MTIPIMGNRSLGEIAKEAVVNTPFTRLCQVLAEDFGYLGRLGPEIEVVREGMLTTAFTLNPKP